MKPPALSTWETLGAALLSLLVACGTSPVAAPPVRNPPADALEIVRNGGDAVSSLRATFVARVSRGAAVERVRGVLLVSKPQRFRLRLSSLFGFTILDYTGDAGSDRLWLASEDRVVVGEEISRAGLFSTASVRWIFLRERNRFQGGCRQRAAGEETIVECGDEGGPAEYRGYVENESRLLVREEVRGGAAGGLHIGYGDYRPTQGVRLPYRIEWAEDVSGARVEIEIDRYEVDPVLSSELFAPMRP